MQYQYSHNGQTYQGHKKAQITRNWNAVREIKPGDWLVAYAKNNRFHAIGEVIAPRRRDRHRDEPHYEDSVHRTLSEKRHEFLNGTVRYTDAPAFYEDFTDDWSIPGVTEDSPETKRWKYPQRVDVHQWQYVNPDGVPVKGINEYRGKNRGQVALKIDRPLFVKIRKQLQQDFFLTAEEAAPDEPSNGGEYVPQDNDRRPLVERQIRERRGQKQFREALRKRYGSRCLISGCEVLAVLEAAHINPYRGDEDNNPANGLLLRSDIHTLFDLDLLGIEPESLRVELHPDVVKEYGRFANVVLACTAKKQPACQALRLRYEQFRLRLQQPG